MNYSPKRIFYGITARISKFIFRLTSYISNSDKFCNACNRKVSGFYQYRGRPFGCPFCRSSNRERFVQYSINTGELYKPFDEARILHVAPGESSLVKLFSTAKAYVPGDIEPSRYHIKDIDIYSVDLTDLSAMGCFDLVYASHVLEHIPDDKKAMKSIFDHLSPGGQAWLLVPLHNADTIEETEPLSARERERLFGQWDHVRQYGMDILARLRSCGFHVESINASDAPGEDIRRYGLDERDKIFCCTKQDHT